MLFGPLITSALSRIPLAAWIPLAWAAVVPGPRLRWVGQLLSDLSAHVPRLIELSKRRNLPLSEALGLVGNFADSFDAIPGWSEVPEATRDRVIANALSLVLFAATWVDSKAIPSQAERRTAALRAAGLFVDLTDLL